MIKFLQPGTWMDMVVVGFCCCLMFCLVAPVTAWTITPAERAAALQTEWQQLTQKHKANRERKADIDQKYDREDEAIIMQAGRVQAEIMRLTMEANSQGLGKGKAKK